MATRRMYKMKSNISFYAAARNSFDELPLNVCAVCDFNGGRFNGRAVSGFVS